MTTNVIQIGNSLGILLPKEFLKKWGISADSTVNVIADDNNRITVESSHRRHLTTEERLRAFYGENRMAAKSQMEPETDWGQPCGEEVW
jgi:antitoxin component of MazEF toxin-antitoxin module